MTAERLEKLFRGGGGA